VSLTPSQVSGQSIALAKLDCKFQASLVALLISLVFYLVSVTQVDSDLWSHHRFSTDLLRSAFFGHQSYCPGPASAFQWLDHQWLSQLAFSVLLQTNGWLGVVWLKIIVSCVTLVFAFNRLCRHRADIFSKAYIVLPAVALLCPYFWAARPQVFSYLCLAIFLTLLQSAFEKSDMRLLWLPLLFTVWANLDGAMIIALLALSVYLIARTVPLLRCSTSEGAIAILWMIFAASFAGAGINPYGAGLLLFLLNPNVLPNLGGTSPIFNDLAGQLFAGYLFILTATIYSIVRTREERAWPVLATWAFFSVLPLLSVHYLPHFLIATLILSSNHLCDLSKRRCVRSVIPSLRTQRLIAAGAFASCAVVVALACNFSTRVWHLPPDSEPTEVALLLKRLNVTGNILCRWDWCEYLTLESDKQMTIYYDHHDNSGCFPIGAWNAKRPTATTSLASNKLQITLVLVDKHDPSFNRMRLKPGWVLAYEDDSSALFCPQDSPYLAKIERYSSITDRSYQFIFLPCIGSTQPIKESPKA
jgi:hypothetical protein